jgi:hypothetical protein
MPSYLLSLVNPMCLCPPALSPAITRATRLTWPYRIVHPADLLPLFAPLLAARLGRLPLLLLLLLPLLLLGQTLVKHHRDMNES